MIKHVYLEFITIYKSTFFKIFIFTFIFLALFGFYQSCTTIVNLEKNLENIYNEISIEMESKGESLENISIDFSDSLKNIEGLMNTIHPESASDYILTIYSTVGPLIFSILGAFIIGIDYQYSTLKLKVAQFGITRVIIHKVIVLMILSISLYVLANLFGFIGGNIAWNYITRNSAVAVNFEYIPLYLSNINQLLTLILGLVFYGILGMGATLLTNNLLYGCLISISVPYIENIFAKWYLPKHLYSILLKNNFLYVEGSLVSYPNTLIDSSLSNNTLLIVLLLITLSLLLVSLLYSKNKTISI